MSLLLSPSPSNNGDIILAALHQSQGQLMQAAQIQQENVKFAQNLDQRAQEIGRKEASAAINAGFTNLAKVKMDAAHTQMKRETNASNLEIAYLKLAMERKKMEEMQADREARLQISQQNADAKMPHAEKPTGSTKQPNATDVIWGGSSREPSGESLEPIVQQESAPISNASPPPGEFQEPPLPVQDQPQGPIGLAPGIVAPQASVTPATEGQPPAPLTPSTDPEFQSFLANARPPGEPGKQGTATQDARPETATDAEWGQASIMLGNALTNTASFNSGHADSIAVTVYPKAKEGDQESILKAQALSIALQSRAVTMKRQLEAEEKASENQAAAKLAAEKQALDEKEAFAREQQIIASYIAIAPPEKQAAMKAQQERHAAAGKPLGESIIRDQYGSASTADTKESIRQVEKKISNVKAMIEEKKKALQEALNSTTNVKSRADLQDQYLGPLNRELQGYQAELAKFLGNGGAAPEPLPTTSSGGNFWLGKAKALPPKT
jgi:hypothetical protein